ncbi:MAG: copper chaperone PCu(A)C [Candidatus Thiodiazotropha sp. (ex Epidulcina cf. delphinae)]|nr:copper chaperone PCu(A)C [Candidatus Thiodiazotropha sp. (ex Epidulcina cf. delphinae)]
MLLGLLLFTTGHPAMADSAGDVILVQDPYVRAVPPGQPNSASFMSLHNPGEQGHVLIGASSPVAEVAELHTHTMEGGMMRMRKMEKVELPGGGHVSLEPGGLHVMMIGLKQKLVPGEIVSLRLLFEDGSQLKVDAPVRKLQMRMKKNEHKGQMH